MEQSPHYRQAISELNDLRHQKVEHGVLREKIREKRTELVLDSAQCARVLTAFINNNPDATIGECEAHIEQQDIIHPEVIKQAIDQLIKKREEARIAVQRFRETAQRNGTSPGYELFQQLQKEEPDREPYTPKGSFIINDTYPLALLLLVTNKDDFNQLHNHTDIGGFYDEHAVGPENSELDPDLTHFPVIVISEESLHETLIDHEKGHAENRIFQNALRATDKHLTWSGTGSSRMAARLAAQEIQQGSEDLESNTKLIIDYALSAAKDELLAELSATEWRLREHMDALKDRETGAYDYFRSIGLDPKSDLYNELWATYESALDEATIPVRHLLSLYNMLGLNERTVLLRWALAQIPLEQWAQFLIERTTLMAEADLLEDRFHEIRNTPALHEQLQAHQADVLLPILQS